MSQNSSDISEDLEVLTSCLIDHSVVVQTRSGLFIGRLEAASLDKDYGLALCVQEEGGGTHNFMKTNFKDIVFLFAENVTLNIDSASMLRRCRGINTPANLQAPPANPTDPSSRIISQRAPRTYPMSMDNEQSNVTILRAPRPGIGLQRMQTYPQIQHNMQQMNPPAVQPSVQMQYNDAAEEVQPFAHMQSYPSEQIQPMDAGHYVSGWYNEPQVGHAPVYPNVPPENPGYGYAVPAVRHWQPGQAQGHHVPPENPGYGYAVPAVRHWQPGQAQGHHVPPGQAQGHHVPPENPGYGYAVPAVRHWQPGQAQGHHVPTERR